MTNSRRLKAELQTWNTDAAVGVGAARGCADARPGPAGTQWWARLAGVLLCCALCACGKSQAPPAAYQAAADPDPERRAENQLRQLLAQVNAREMEVAAMARAAENEVGASSGVAGRAERDQYYTNSQYLDSLRGAESAITNKMTALAVERAILANANDNPNLRELLTAPTWPEIATRRKRALMGRAAAGRGPSRGAGG